MLRNYINLIIHFTFSIWTSVNLLILPFFYFLCLYIIFINYNLLYSYYIKYTYICNPHYNYIFFYFPCFVIFKFFVDFIFIIYYLNYYYSLIALIARRTNIFMRIKWCWNYYLRWAWKQSNLLLRSKLSNKWQLTPRRIHFIRYFFKNYHFLLFLFFMNFLVIFGGRQSIIQKTNIIRNIYCL
jgi:hypothetical protein